MNIGMHIPFWAMFFSEYMLRSGISGLNGSSIFNFLGTSTLFSIVAVSIYIPTNSLGRFPPFNVLFSIYSLWNLLMKAILTGMRWNHMVAFIWISLIISHVEHFFFHEPQPSVCLLWRNVYLGCRPTFGLGCLFCWC